MSKAVIVKPKATVVKPDQYKMLNGRTRDQAKRVAAYCRVSTDSEEQLNSYQAQVTHYTALIHNTPEWEFVDLYADEGISGTNSKNRPEFQRMIKDAKAGKIDLILTKSISRFGRNTMDVLKYSRELKEKGVAINFEKENINTMDASGEMFLTIFSSLAQEESRSISENSRWGIVKGFKDGKVFCNTNRFLGYDKDEHGNLIINRDQAEVVKRIYREYLEGKSYGNIAKGLMNDGILTGAGKEKWWDSTVNLILKNEKYYGALLQQKTVTIDYLTHKRVRNNGYSDQYLIEENHEPIVSKEVWDQVQKEIQRRANLKGNYKGQRGKYSNKYPFSGKVICGDCGSIFKRRYWNSNNPSRKVVWQCKTYINDGKDACDMKAVDDDVLKQAFVDMFNKLNLDKEEFFSVMMRNIEKIIVDRNHHDKMKSIDDQIESVKDELKSLMRLHTKQNLDEEVYAEEYTRLSDQLNNLRDSKANLEAIQDRKDECVRRMQEIAKVINEREELLEEFDKDLYNALVDKIEVIGRTHFVFVLKSGIRMDMDL